MTAIQHKTGYDKAHKRDRGLNCMRLDSISTSIEEYHNNKKLLLKHNWQTQRQQHKYLIIGWCLGTRNREVFQGINQQWFVAEIMIFKRPALRQLILFFSSSYLFTYIHSSWIKITSTYFCLLGVHFFTPVIKKKKRYSLIYLYLYFFQW